MKGVMLPIVACPNCKANHPVLFWPHSQEIILCKCGAEIGGFEMLPDGAMVYRCLPPKRANMGKDIVRFHRADDTALEVEQ